MMFVLIGGKYDWISEIQPGISSELIEDHSNNRQITKLFLLFVMIITQVPLLFVKNIYVRVLSSALISLSLILSFM
jgi:hypothetical protein